MSPDTKLKVAWFSEIETSPKPGQAPTLSSYFSSRVLPHLSDKAEITIFSNTFKKYDSFKSYHYLKAAELDLREAYDIFFYQLEDDARANFVRSHIGMIPGITYFHHFNLTNYGPEPLLNSPYRDIVEKFNLDKPGWPERGKKYKPQGPAAYREAALSPIAIFSNPQTLNEYRRLIEFKLRSSNPDRVNAFYLPYPVDCKPVIGKERSQEGDGKLRIAMAAAARTENRPHKVLSALNELGGGYRLKWMVKPGEKEQAMGLLKEYQVREAEISETYDPQAWISLLAEANCALLPLYSAYSHIEPYLGISLMAGCPTIVTNFGSAEYLPDKLVIKIHPGQDEGLQIADVLRGLISGGLDIDRALSRDFAIETYDSEQVASELLSVFLQRRDELLRFRSDWRRMEQDARTTLIQEAYGYTPDCESMLSNVFSELGWK